MLIIDEENNRIIYNLCGDKGQYINHLKALIVALGSMHEYSIEQKNARETISAMLAEMTPNEDQLK